MPHMVATVAPADLVNSPSVCWLGTLTDVVVYLLMSSLLIGCPSMFAECSVSS